tara:strand:- start:5190 stop:5456 length:267 start_codon:yes stop_codon:yes gene_type:complete
MNINNDNLVKEVKDAITWLSEVARFSQTDLRHGLADRAKRLSNAIGQDVDERIESLLYRDIDKDRVRVIEASKKNEMHTPPNAWQDIK